MSYTLTEEGRARIVAGQNKRWKAFRKERKAEKLVEAAGNKIVHPKKKAPVKSDAKRGTIALKPRVKAGAVVKKRPAVKKTTTKKKARS